jgi:hypothetical protein
VQNAMVIVKDMIYLRIKLQPIELNSNIYMVEPSDKLKAFVG